MGEEHLAKLGIALVSHHQDLTKLGAQDPAMAIACSSPPSRSGHGDKC